MRIEPEVPKTEPSAKESSDVACQAAERGDEDSVEALRLWLGRPSRNLCGRPVIWRPMLKRPGSGLAAGGNVLVEESIRCEADRVRQELLSTTPTIWRCSSSTKSSACWLNLKQAEIWAASSRQSSPSQGRYHAQRVEGAQRRYFAAIKMLAQVRGLPLSALIPTDTSHVQTGPEAGVVGNKASGQGGSTHRPPVPSHHGLHVLPESRDLPQEGLTVSG